MPDVPTGEFAQHIRESERSKMADSNLSNLITAMAANQERAADAAAKQGVEILAEVRAIKDRVGDHAVLLGKLETRQDVVEKKLQDVVDQNRNQENRLRFVEQKPERAKSIDDDLKSLAQDIKELTRAVTEGRTKQTILNGAIVLLGSGAVVAFFELVFKSH